MDRFPIASIIIPACNEQFAIKRCLETLLKDARPGEFEIIVVCNGCNDDTSLVAQGFEPFGVTVMETATASKSKALRIGDGVATQFPRLYLDADIHFTTDAARTLVQFLSDNPLVLASSPRATVDTSASDFLVRAYYRVWTSLPYFNDDLLGSGLYSLSKKGRSLFQHFPDVIADDEFVRRTVAPSERQTCPASSFRLYAPRDVRTLVRVLTRVRLGLRELDHEFPKLAKTVGTSMKTTILTLMRRPKLWSQAPIYLALVCLAEWRAGRTWKQSRFIIWHRDETNRRA
ncbi:glycosyltransferase [Aliishimia ponticola]|uniref:Glycosyltransferase n=1 Tax=Aliishimia ponticola TaxID=2499833 RepID=A0A4V6S239_9RHOB|nr:glycosyltransferase [Aliishimia ponticola]THH38553.1 glycosyltransferase [Aliishimia ponticola]